MSARRTGVGSPRWWRSSADARSAAVVSYVQVGVVSYGLSPDCGGTNVGFYTSTSHWRAWIATTLAANGQAA